MRPPRFHHAALLTYPCPRYQHLDIYLRKPGTSVAPAAATARNTAGPSVTVSGPGAPNKQPAGSPVTSAPAAGAAPEETALESKQRQLPAIDFSGEREPPRKAAPGGDRGRGRGGVKPPPKPPEQTAAPPAREPNGGGGDTGKEGGESGEETTSVDGEEDFLALPTESEERDCGESGGGSTEGEVRFVPRRRSVGVGRVRLPLRQEKTLRVTIIAAATCYNRPHDYLQSSTAWSGARAIDWSPFCARI